MTVIISNSWYEALSHVRRNMEMKIPIPDEKADMFD